MARGQASWCQALAQKHKPGITTSMSEGTESLTVWASASQHRHGGVLAVSPVARRGTYCPLASPS